MVLCILGMPTSLIGSYVYAMLMTLPSATKSTIWMHAGADRGNHPLNRVNGLGYLKLCINIIDERGGSKCSINGNRTAWRKNQLNGVPAIGYFFIALVVI